MSLPARCVRQRLIACRCSCSYLRLIDECITRIVFSKSACDPDFDTYSMDSESIGESGLGLNDHTPSVRNGSLHDLSQMAGHALQNLTATENEIQINLMKGRVEHLEQSREKLTKVLETMLTKVTSRDRSERCAEDLHGFRSMLRQRTI